MQTENFSKNKDTTPVGYRLYLLLVIMQGTVALWSIFRVKSESGTHFLWDFSGTRLITAAFILALSLAAIALLVETWSHPARFNGRLNSIAQFMNKPRRVKLILLLLGTLFLLGVYFITIYPDISEPFARGVVNRLLPVAIWATGLDAQTIIALLIMHYGVDLSKSRPIGKTFFLSCLVLGIIFLTWSLAMKEIYATESQLTGWNNMGVPIIETQLFIAWGASLIMFALIKLVHRDPKPSFWIRRLLLRKFDILVALLLWLVAVILWESVQITPNWFLAQPTVPNFEYYPTSDARTYDIVGQSALIGEGYKFLGSAIIKRPLHALYITVLRFLGGQNYETVAFLQIMVLALFPVFIYYFTKNLHNHISGVMAALIIILRETNSIAIAGTITTSHVKLIMVDLPAAFTNLIFIYLAVQMLLYIQQKGLLTLFSGAALGFSMLLRFEVFVLFFPLVSVLALLLFPKRQYSLWFRKTLLITLGLVLAILPWIWRNWQTTGMFFIDSPYFLRYTLISQRFQPVGTPTTAPTKLTVEPKGPATTPTPSGYSTIVPATNTPQIVSPLGTQKPPSPSLSEEEKIRASLVKAFSFIKNNPEQLLRSFTMHYLNSQLQTILILPTSDRVLESFISFLGHRSMSRLWEECCSVNYYIRRMPYWHKWDGVFPYQSIIPLVINSILLATGINEAWKKHRLVGIVPMIFLVTYLGFNAIFRNSGGRYVLPLDWIVVVYFCIGLAHVSTLLIAIITRTKISQLPVYPQNDAGRYLESENPLRSPRTISALIIVILIAWTIPWIEKSFPQLYPETRKQEMLKNLFQSKILTDSQNQDLKTFINRGGWVFAGRALYPQHYRANAGGIGDRTSPQSPKPYARLIFELIGQHNSPILMPYPKRPAYFPNASDVLVFMCPQEDVLSVAVFNAENVPRAIFISSSYQRDLLCLQPLPETGE